MQNLEKNVLSTEMWKVSLIAIGMVLRLGKGMRGQWSNDQGKQQIKYAPPLYNVAPVLALLHQCPIEQSIDSR